MTIETASPADQLNLTGKTRIAADALQRFAQREDPITAEQAAPIDAALQALSAALLAAGVGTVLPGTQTVLTSGTKRPCGTVTGTGTFVTPTIANGVITGLVLSAS